MQNDNCGNQWSIETWYKNDCEQYICEYNDCHTLDNSVFDGKDAQIFMKETRDMERRMDVTVEVNGENPQAKTVTIRDTFISIGNNMGFFWNVIHGQSRSLFAIADPIFYPIHQKDFSRF